MIVNTSRGGVIKTPDMLDALNSGQVGYYGMDVYEFERGTFSIICKGNIERSVAPKAYRSSQCTGDPHQAFATHEALTNIADATFKTYRNGKAAE